MDDDRLLNLTATVTVTLAAHYRASSFCQPTSLSPTEPVTRPQANGCGPAPSTTICSQSQIGRCCRLRGWEMAQVEASRVLSMVGRSGTGQVGCEWHARGTAAVDALGIRLRVGSTLTLG